MAAILQTLSGNPFLTTIGQKIEQATDQSLPSEDWALFMEICDMINDTDEGPNRAARAIKRRLQQNAGKNHTVVMYTLTLLETCVKNCGKRFHTLVTSKDFINDLVKIIGPRNDPTPALQEKVLNLIQTWSKAFRGQPECSGVVQVYNELKSKGFIFPTSDPDTSVPILTPQRSVPPYTRKPVNDINVNQTSAPSLLPYLTGSTSGNERRLNMSGASVSPIILTQEQLVKLRSELDVVQGNIKVFNEMLTELVPGKEHSDDWSLLRDLNSTCLAMQKRIVDLIEKVATEEVTNELLRINDELNNLFERYERYERKRNSSLSIAASSNATSANVLEAQEPSLIDLNANDPEDILSKELQGLTMAKTSLQQPKPTGLNITNDADFDFFAQSRTLSHESKAKPLNTNIGSVGQINPITQDSLGSMGTSFGEASQIPSERDFKEMDRWLKEQRQEQVSIQHNQEPEMNFEKFLAKRAEAADKLPK